MKTFIFSALLALAAPASAENFSDLSCKRMNTVFERPDIESASHQKQVLFSYAAISYKTLVKGYGLAKGSDKHQKNFEKVLVLCSLRPESNVVEVLADLNWEAPQ